MFDLTKLTLSELTQIGSGIRIIEENCQSMEEVAQKITQFLFKQLVFGENQEPAAALIRLFKTHTYNDLTPELQNLAHERLEGDIGNGQFKCLTLLGSAGTQPDWNFPDRSKNHRAIPLPTKEFLQKFRMISGMLNQLGMDLDQVLSSEQIDYLVIENQSHQVFFVGEAEGSELIPAQENFVKLYGIKSVVGFGGVLPSGNMFSVLLFLRVSISKDTAALFRVLAEHVKIALLPFNSRVFNSEKNQLTPPSSPQSLEEQNFHISQKAEALQSLLVTHEDLLKETTRKLSQEIKSREELLKSLEKADEQKNLILNSAWEGIYGLDLDGNTTFLNSAAEKMLGFSEKELLGQPQHAYVHHTRKDGTPYSSQDCPIFSAVKNGRVAHSSEEVFWRKDGTCFPVEYSSTPIKKDGTLIGAVVSFKDISDRIKNEAALNRLTGFQKTVLSEASTSIIATDVEGTITLFNKAAERMLGYTAEEMVNKHTPQIIHDPEEVIARAKELSLQYGTTIEPGFEVFVHQAKHEKPESLEWTYIRKDGRRVPILLSVSVLRDKDGSISGFLGVGTDLTENKKIETEKNRAFKLLEKINEIQLEFFRASSNKALFEMLLDTFLESTQSQFGFLGEIMRSNEGKPYLKTHAISNIAWNEETLAFYENNVLQGLEFSNMDSLFGEVITTGQLLITNDPKNHPKSAGVPAGHPPLESFMGLPLHIGDSIIGMVGLANSPDGYKNSLAEFINPLTNVAANLIHARKSETRRLEIEQNVRDRESQMRAVLNNVIDGIITIDSKGSIQQFSLSAERIFGYTAEEVMGRNVNMLMPEPFFSEHDGYLKRYRETGKGKIIGIGREVVGKRKNGSTFPLELSISELTMQDQPLFVGLTRDITEQKRAMDAREQLASIVENTDDAIWGQEMDGTITLWNNAAKRIFGYSEIEIQGKESKALVPEDRSAEVFYILEKIRRGETLSNFQTQRRHKDGRNIEVSLTVSPIHDQDQKIVGASTIARDITNQVTMLQEKEKLIQKLEELTLSDPLTELLNRRGMMQRLEFERSRYRRFGGNFSVLLVDVDHFKAVNDTYGHDVGDDALKFLSEIFKSSCREQDSVSRWGGEEFLILLVQTNKDGALNFANKLLETVRSKTLVSGETSLSLTVSMGLVTAQGDNDSPDELIRRADELLYRAKNEGRDRVEVEIGPNH